MKLTDPHGKANDRTKRTPSSQKLGKVSDTHPSHHPFSSMHASVHSGPDTEIFSDDPVPQGSRAFWDRVLAEAGTPTRVQTASMATATLIEPSDEFLNSTHSSKGSIDSVSGDPNTGSSDLQSHSFHDPAGSLSFETPYASRSSSSQTDHGTHAEKAEQRPPPREIIQSLSPRSRLSFFPFRRKARPEAGKSSDSMEIGHVDHSLSGSMAVDGPSDRHSSDYRDSLDFDQRAKSPDPDDGLYGSRRDRRTISQAFSEDQARGQHTEALTNRQGDRTVLPPPRAFGHSRNYSGTRSSLYISEAAASSSPERRPTTPIVHNSNGLESRGLLSQPPRRPKMYRRRSQTYSYTQSEDSPHADVPQMDGPSTVEAITNRIPSLSISSPPRYSVSPPGSRSSRQQTPTTPGRTSDRSFPSSPPTLPPLRSPYSTNSPASPQETIEIRSYRSASSILSSHSRAPSLNSNINPSPSYTHSIPRPLPQRNLSPYAGPFVLRSAHRVTSSQLVLPPPFSATSRNVSISNSLPPSSPASPHTPPPRQTSVSISPSTNQPRTPPRRPSGTTVSISPPRNPSPRRVPVYNDNVSPTTQPQTPVGLPRHGIPAMHTQNAAFTAPVGRGLGRFSSRAMAEWQAFATPTRRGTVAVARGEMDQENVGRIPQEERRIRREREMGAGE